MRGNTNFLSNGYAVALIQTIFDNYSSVVYINSYDILALKRFVPGLSYVDFISNNKLRFKGPTVTISFDVTLVEDNKQPNGSLRFEGKLPDYKLLFADSRLPSGRLEQIALITEEGEYLAI